MSYAKEIGDEFNTLIYVVFLVINWAFISYVVY